MEKPKQPFLSLDRQPVLSLITPSASPPASRSTSHDRDGQPSPAKRPRLNLTPSTVSSPSPSVRAQSQSEAPKFDFEAARHESTMRVLNVWSQLAERYTRRLDEDDIIDLRSGNVIKDRGVLRKAQAEYRFGYITQEDGPSNDASSDGGAITEGEDDLDEVDALVADEGISAELNAELERVKHKGFDAADQDDLREFLEAEKRIQHGREMDEDYSDDEIGDLSTIMRGEEAERRVLVPRGGDAGSSGTDWDEPPDDVDGGVAISSGDDSEDELGAWEPDESNALYAVSTELSDTEPPIGPPFSLSDHIEEIEISDTPPSSPSPRWAQNTSAVHSTMSVRATPDTTTSRPSKRRRSPSVAVQLQTPPRSFSSHIKDSEVPLADPSPTIPSRHSSLSYLDSGTSADLPAAPARNMYLSAIAGGSAAPASSSLRQEESAKESASSKKQKSVKKKASRSTLVPEVVLERRSHYHTVPRRTSSVSITNDKRLASTPSAPGRPDKGKAKAQADSADSPGQPSKHPPSVLERPSRKTRSPSLSPLDSKGKGRAASPIVIEISSDEEVRPPKASSRNIRPTAPAFDEDPEPPGPPDPPTVPVDPPAPGPHPQQVQYYLAQAMHHLSYFMDAAGISNPQKMPPAPGPPQQGLSHCALPYPPPLRAPQTPTHHSRREQKGSSRRNGPSHASASKRPTYGNATHSRSSLLSTPSSSFATLPPSSPEPASSPSITSSLKQRSPSRGRSRPLGRRVSFKLGDGPPVVSGRLEDESDSDSSLDPLASKDLDVPSSSSPAIRAATTAARSAKQRVKPLQRQMLGRSGSKGRPNMGVFEPRKR